MHLDCLVASSNNPRWSHTLHTRSKVSSLALQHLVHTPWQPFQNEDSSTLYSWPSLCAAAPAEHCHPGWRLGPLQTTLRRCGCVGVCVRVCMSGRVWGGGDRKEGSGVKSQCKCQHLVLKVMCSTLWSFQETHIRIYGGLILSSGVPELQTSTVDEETTEHATLF